MFKISTSLPYSRQISKLSSPLQKRRKKGNKSSSFFLSIYFSCGNIHPFVTLIRMEVSQVVHRCSTNFRNSKKKEGKRRAKEILSYFFSQNVTPRAMQYSSTTNYTRDEDRGGRDLGQGQASGLALVHRLLESVKKRCMQVASIDPATRCFNLRPRYTRPLKTERVASFSTFPSIRFSPRCSSFEHFDARPISRARMYREPGYMHQGGEECKLHRWPRIILCHGVCPSASNALCADEIVFSASSSRIRQKCN